MINVTFDLNSLSKILLFNGAVTGIGRVTLELSQALLAYEEGRPEVDVKLSTLVYPQASSLLASYYNKLGFPNKLLPVSKMSEWVYRQMIDNRIPFHQGRMLGRVIPPFYKRGRDLDIFHSPFYPLKSYFSNTKTVKLITVHDIIALTNKEYFTGEDSDRFKCMFSKVAVGGDHYFSVSNYTKNEFCSYYSISEDKVSVVPLAASAHLFYRNEDPNSINLVKDKYGIPEGDYILSVATLEPRKNIPGLIRAFHSLVEETGDRSLYLVLVGKQGWKTKALDECLKLYKSVSNQLVFTGHVDDQDLSSLYSNALMFVYPSFMEGFGLPPLEAMQCGTPVITSNTSSLPEVVGSAGLLINPAVKEDLCQAMWDVVRNDSLRADLSRKGLLQAEKFSWDKTAAMSVEVYRSLAGSK